MSTSTSRVAVHISYYVRLLTIMLFALAGFRYWLVDLRPDEAALSAIICWHIWCNRNNKVWAQKSGIPDDVISAAEQQLAAWRIARSSRIDGHVGSVEKGDGMCRWRPPEVGWVKCNVDAALFGDDIGIGCVVRDHFGAVVQAKKMVIQGTFSPRTAEAIGIREVLSWLKGWSKLIVESDAMDVVLGIRNPDREDSDVVVCDCADMAKQFHNLKFCFVRRSANRAAHVMAHNARFTSGHQEWFLNCPEFLSSVIASDLLE
ncbi:uncharacterized protein LOC126687490 [Mercurialis annua]|uniref:uncharacterized protein LOC126687490 n=1 Tax=Mercurialis annua TaxID=3986 RepID=UPI00215E422D|nr:uncharacterized protein LOC126687490 [Mercurialis annua]